MFCRPNAGFISSILTLLALSGCFAQTDNSVNGDANAFAPVAANSSKEYAQVHAILKKSCMPCHANDIASYSEAQCVAEGLVVPKLPYQSMLFQRLKGSNAGGSSDMPQNGPALSEGQIQTIRNWIEGMDPTTNPTPPAPTTPFGRVQVIIKTSCAHCHNKPDDDFGHFNEADFVSNGYVVPGWAMESDFYAKLIGSGGTEAGKPNMPLKGAPLTVNQLEDVRNWINGMPTPTHPGPPTPPTPPVPATPFAQAQAIMNVI